MTITRETAAPFVTDWFDAWNRHDVEAITAHYAADIEYFSPFVADITGGTGRLHGIDAVTAYFRAALERFPDLHFDPPLHVAVGAGSVAFVYRSVNGLLAVETLVFDQTGRVSRAHCHYSPS
jgi:ketosteroid isomerase-like protein